MNYFRSRLLFPYFKRFAKTVRKLDVLEKPGLKVYFNDIASQVDAVTSVGDVGILNDHVPAILFLTPGPLKIIQPGKVSNFIVSSGSLVVHEGSVVHIMVSAAATKDEIDSSKISEEENRLKQLISKTTDPSEIAAANAALEALQIYSKEA